MAAATDIGLYKDALIVLATAAIVVPAMHRLKVGPILGFLAVGAALGPHGLGQLVDAFPLFGWFTVTGEKQIEFIAELGVVFLLMRVTGKDVVASLGGAFAVALVRVFMGTT